MHNVWQLTACVSTGKEVNENSKTKPQHKLKNFARLKGWNLHSIRQESDLERTNFMSMAFTG